MDSQVNKPLTTAPTLDKGTQEPLLRKEPLNKPLLSPTLKSETLLAGQSSAAGGISNLPSTGYVTYTESTLEPIITIKDAPTSETFISTSASLLPGQQSLKSKSPRFDLESGETSRLGTLYDQQYESGLTRNAGAELMDNSGETKSLGPVEPSPYPTTVGTGTVGIVPGAEIPANLGGMRLKFMQSVLHRSEISFFLISNPCDYWLEF